MFNERSYKKTMQKSDKIRKIVKNGRGSYYVNIPKEVLRALGWKERQKVVVKKSGKKVVIADWPEEKR